MALWRSALGEGHTPSVDQEAAIVAPAMGRHSVNAGAGTGKTSTLALRALYLVEAGYVRADQIVVLTFTKKAAAEVGSRIRDTIDAAIARGARFDGADRGVECTTIHALAARILTEFAFDFDFAVAPRAISDGEAHGIFHDAFRALLHGDLAVDTTAFPIAEMNLATLERDLGKLALRLKNHGISPAAFASRATANAERYGCQSWGALWTAGTGKNAGKPKEVEPKVALTAAERRREAERDCENIRVVTALFVEFDRRLTQRGAATYGDLIGLTTRLLGERPALVTRLRARWRYLLLDESQDTSILQLAFIETLFGQPGDADASGMMPVGDTRQAIYGFNGADELVMERLASSADGQHPLITNRRSSQEIVDAGHVVLERAGIIDASTPKLLAAAGSRGLASVRVQNFGQDGETIKEHVEYEAAGIAREVQRLIEHEAANANDIAILVRRRTHAAKYVRALNTVGIPAALDRRSGLFVTDEIRDALAWMSWLVDLADQQAAVRVLQSPACGLSDATMIALAGHKSWLNDLLDDVISADIDVDTRERLNRVRDLLGGLLTAAAIPLAPAIRQILSTLPIAASYAKLGTTIGAQAIANLRGFEELALSFAQEQPGARLCDFVDDVKRRILYDDDLQEAELDVDGVRILTIHQAKGLEWPFVFVACSTKHQYANAEPTDRVVIYDLSSGAFTLKHDIDGRETFRWAVVSTEHDPQTGERIKPGSRKRVAEREQARVFYVALTRAKQRVYITAPAPLAGTGAAVFLASIRDWAEACEPDVDLTFDTGVVAQRPSGALLEPLARSRIIERLPSTGQPQLSIVPPRISFSAISAFATCPRMARYRYRLYLPDLREAGPRFVGLTADESARTNAARLGSLAHRALELWGRAQINKRPIPVGEAFASAVPDFADATAAEQDGAKISAEHAARALEHFELLEVETPFEVAIGETVVEGVIDLIARRPDGRVIVIDYKTGRTDADHYALQMNLYHHVASLRYPDEEVGTAILRLSMNGAVFLTAQPLPAGGLERAIVDAGSFESDVANPGEWCHFCSYRQSPCMSSLDATA